MELEVLGVYPVEEASQPCHIVDIRVSGRNEVLDVGSFYQPPKLKDATEQVPYLEYLLNLDGTAGSEWFGELALDGELRLAFFIHYLDENWRLASPIGILQLPTTSPRPDRLKFMKYSEP